MCGICGSNFEDKELILSMMKEMYHRGPDDHGTYSDSQVTLGHNRLSIIDLSKKGHQPMWSRDGEVGIVFNGEIYNYKEIKTKLEELRHHFISQTDTEVIIEAYREYGINALSLFNGMFAFCLYDRNKQRLILARDRTGEKPLYYYFDGRSFLFASEIKALLKAPIKRYISQEALNAYFTFRYNNTAQTMIKNIFKLPPAHYIIFNLKTNDLHLEKYWDVDTRDTAIINLPEDHYVAKLDALLKESVKLRMMSDVPVGVYLSGGVDSSAIVAYMHSLGQEIKTFSVVSDDPRFEDQKYSAMVAEYFGTKHKEINIEIDALNTMPQLVHSLDEPLADPSALASYLMSKHVRPDAIVVHNGAGGDELFGGYDHHAILLKNNSLQKRYPRFHSIGKNSLKVLPPQLAKVFSPYLSGHGLKGKERILSLMNSTKNVDAYLALTAIMDYPERISLLGKNAIDQRNVLEQQYFSSNADFLRQIALTEIKNFLVEDIHMMTDKTTMASSLESRAPLLDHTIIELAFQMPPSLWIQKMTGKYILKKTLIGKVPKKVLTRKKQGFYIPYDTWLKKDIRSNVFETVMDFSIQKNILKQDYIMRMQDKFSESPLYYSRQLWAMYSFALWYKEYIENINI